MDTLKMMMIGVGTAIIVAICLALFFAFGIAVTPHIEARKLESNGEIPTNASYNYDWPVAQYTSWWGKRIDPDTFWKGRPIWLDASATDAARRHGREYPPIPSTATNSAWLAQFSDKDEGHKSGGPDSGPFITFYGSDRENVYWNDFWRTHLKPPEDLTREQSLVAQDSENTNIPNFEKSRAIQLAYPPEAFTDEALYACRTGIRSKEASAWKISYLQRLRRENTDNSYIDAYLKAWNLSATEVFSTNSSSESSPKTVP